MSRRPFVAALLVALLAWCAERPTRACTCRAVSIEEQARAAPVAVIVDILDDREEGGVHVARGRVVEALRGTRAGDVVEIHWRAPDGKSCDFVTLRKGRWLLFLAPDEERKLWTLRCDQGSTPLGGAAGNKALAAARVALAGKLTRDEAVRRAVPVANAALEEAYARKDEDGLRPRRRDPWVTAQGATAVPAANGWRVRWSHHPPAGFEHDVEVEVLPQGKPRVLEAVATFSPD